MERVPNRRSNGVVRRLGCAVLLFASASWAHGADPLHIVDDGQSDFQIVVQKSALPATLLAATELQYFIWRSTGARLPIVAPYKQGAHSIILKGDDSLPRAGFFIKADGGNLLISGHDTPGDPRRISYQAPVATGTLHGVYDLLESSLGVRFYWPDDLGTIVPTRRNLSIPADHAIEQAPRFSLRRLRFGPQYKNDRNEATVRLWGRRLRLGTAKSMNFYHNHYKVLNVEEWARRGHPEYAALVRGKRQIKYGKNHHWGQVCVSNPAVQKIFIDAARAADPGMFSLSPNDGLGMCECGPCRAMDSGRTISSGQFAGKPDLSDRMMKFDNIVAAGSGRSVGRYAYNQFVDPPVNTRPDPRVTIALVVNSAWLTVNDDMTKWTEQLCRAWGAYATTATLYDIFYRKKQHMTGLIAPLGTDVERRIHLVADSGLDGALFYIAREMEQGGPDAYVAAKMLWNPQVDTAAIREAYFRDLYGPGWRHIQRLFERAAQVWRQAVTRYKKPAQRRRAVLDAAPEFLAAVDRATHEARRDQDARSRLTRLRKAIRDMRP